MRAIEIILGAAFIAWVIFLIAPLDSHGFEYSPTTTVAEFVGELPSGEIKEVKPLTGGPGTQVLIGEKWYDVCLLSSQYNSALSDLIDFFDENYYQKKSKDPRGSELILSAIVVAQAAVEVTSSVCVGRPVNEARMNSFGYETPVESDRKPDGTDA